MGDRFVQPNRRSKCIHFLKTASALPVPPLGQTAPGPIYPGLPRAGISPVAPGHATMTGIQQRPIGLDKPQDTRAAAMPGMPGHAATYVIDQQGALDPRGLTVDGNNAASLVKFRKLASSVAQLADRDLEAAKAADIRRVKAALEARRTALAVSPAGSLGKVAPLVPQDTRGLADSVADTGTVGSLSPEEWPFRMEGKDPGARSAAQVENLRPKAEASTNNTDMLKDLGNSPGGAAAAMIQEELRVGRSLSALAGPGSVARQLASQYFWRKEVVQGVIFSVMGMQARTLWCSREQKWFLFTATRQVGLFH